MHLQLISDEVAMTLTDLGLEQKNLSFKVGCFLMQATGILVQVMVKKMSNMYICARNL